MLKKKSAGSWLAKREPQLLSIFKIALPDHESYFRPHFFDFYGLAMFVRKTIRVREEGELFIYRENGFIDPDEYGNHARNLQYVVIETEKGPRLIVNLHGLWNRRGKTDCEERLEQSDRIVAFLQAREEPVILVGDFNLLPSTESLRRIEATGLPILSPNMASLRLARASTPSSSVMRTTP